MSDERVGDWALRWADEANHDLSATREAARALAYEVRRLQPDGPRLGLATTRELLAEVWSRCHLESVDDPEAWKVADAAARGLDLMEPAVLDYRTVEGT